MLLKAAAQHIGSISEHLAVVDNSMEFKENVNVLKMVKMVFEVRQLVRDFHYR